MQQYDSNTFNTDQGRQDVPGGAAFFNNSLYYVVSHGGGLNLIKCTPPSGQDNWTVVAPPASDWNSYWSNGSIQAKSGSPFSTPLVTLPAPGGGSTLYAMGANSTVYMMNADQKTFTPIPIQSANGTQVETCGATAWGNYLVVGWNLSDANLLMWDCYNTADLPNPINPEFVWKPEQESGGIPQSFNLPSTGLGTVVSMDWFTMGADNFYLVTSYMSQNEPVLLVTPMENGVAVASPEAVGTFLVVQNTGGQDGITVLRDPAGRIRLYTVSSVPAAAKGIPSACVATIATVTDPFGPNSAWTQDFSALWNVIGQGMKANQAPVGCFVLGGPYPLTDPVGTANDVYEVALFSPDHNKSIWCDISAYGTAQLLPNYRTGHLLPDTLPNNYVGIVSGIIDSPIPVPGTNIANGTYAPGYDFGTVDYGFTSSESENHDASFAYSVGISSSMVTSAGFGPAWNIAFSAGKTTSEGTSQLTSQIQNLSVPAELGSNGELTAIGSFYANGAEFQYDWYCFQDLDGTWTGNGPLFCNIVAVLESSRANSFKPYLVVPGDLNSYTLESINAQAANIGLVSQGTDYVATVIEANALPIGVGGENYMQYSISNGAQVTPGFVQINDNWTETSWTYDASVYVGVSGGLQVSLDLGVTFAGFTQEDLAGFTLSASHSTTDDTSTQLQIQLQEVKWPVAIKETDINNCNFRLYLLPANQRWVQELEQVLKMGLDTNSQPWRIFFLVTSYSSVDGSISYP
jgi:hypothetical protein